MESDVGAKTLQDVLVSRRKEQLQKDMRRILAPLAIMDSTVLDEITSLFKWTQVYNDLDVFLDTEMTQQDPMAKLKSDFIFERVLGHQVVKNED